MASSVPPQAAQAPETIALVLSPQEVFISKTQATCQTVVKEVFAAIVNSANMAPRSLVDTVITPKQATLSTLDERTAKFFNKIMGTISGNLNKVPQFAFFFAQIEAATKENNLGKKLAEGIALPHIRTLIGELDAVDRNIVDTLIAN